MPKEKKSAAELAELIMAQIREHLACRHLIDVVVTEAVQTAAHHPNWNAAFVVDGNEVPPPPAFHIITKLQSEYDLV